MATIKTTGSGAELRIITQTIEGQARISCLCCGCASVPDEITIVFSGLTVCEPEYPTPVAMATLTRFSINAWFYLDTFNLVEVICTTSKCIHEFLPDRVGLIPEGIAPDDTSTPLFSIGLSGESAPITFSNAFGGSYCVKDSPLANFLDFAGCDLRDNWAYGGTAQISCE